METGNHRDRNKIICCSRCEGTRGNGMQLHTVEWHYPSNLLPSILSPMETWKRRHLWLLCCEMTLALSPPPATAILPLWSVTEDAALFVCTISSMKFDA